MENQISFLKQRLTGDFASFVNLKGICEFKPRIINKMELKVLINEQKFDRVYFLRLKNLHS